MKNSEQNKDKIPQVKISKETHYSGPLPLPEDLAKYDSVLPGAAERIIKMAEEEMHHRHNNEKTMTKSIIVTTTISISFAFLSVIILSGLVFYALYKGFDTVASTIAVGSIAAVAGVFIFFKSKQTKEE